MRIVPLKDGNGATPIALRVEIHGCPGNVTKQTKHSNKHVTHVCLFIFVCLFVCLLFPSLFLRKWRTFFLRFLVKKIGINSEGLFHVASSDSQIDKPQRGGKLEEK